MLGPGMNPYYPPPYPFLCMRASYYAIRDRVPRNSKGAKARGISLSNMTGHGRPTHPFFVRTRTTLEPPSCTACLSRKHFQIFAFARLVEKSHACWWLLRVRSVFEKHFEKDNKTNYMRIFFLYRFCTKRNLKRALLYIFFICFSIDILFRTYTRVAFPINYTTAKFIHGCRT